MPKLKYIGFADVRTISAADFKKVGVEDQSIISVDLTKIGGSRVVEVNEQAANYLLENESATWQIVKEAEASEPKDK